MAAYDRGRGGKAKGSSDKLDSSELKNNTHKEIFYLSLSLNRFLLR